MNTLETSFRDYLISQGYKQTTPSGQPSTVYDYCKRIAFVCNTEGLTWQGVKTNIKTLIKDYDYDGRKSILGARSHNSVINALKRFHEGVCKGKI